MRNKLNTINRKKVKGGGASRTDYNPLGLSNDNNDRIKITLRTVNGDFEIEVDDPGKEVFEIIREVTKFDAIKAMMGDNQLTEGDTFENAGIQDRAILNVFEVI